jgi:MFS family permease
MALSATSITHLFIGGALIIALATIPLMIDTILGFSPLEGGLRLLRLTVMIPIGAVVGGFLCQRWGYRKPILLGLLFCGMGFLLMNRWDINIADPWLTVHLAITGLGFGLVISPITTAALNSVSANERSVTSALVTMMRMIGMIIGLSVLSSWGMENFRTMTADMSLTDIINAPEELINSVLVLFQDFFLAAAVLSFLPIIPTRWITTRNANDGKEV